MSKAQSAMAQRAMGRLARLALVDGWSATSLAGKPGKSGKPYPPYGALCFEPQGYPDAPHREQFWPVGLHPGERYDQTIVCRFSAE